jgi:hypothetical protein
MVMVADGIEPNVPQSEQAYDTSDTPKSYAPPLLVEDYIFRGHELDDYSIYELACMTTAKGSTSGEQQRYKEANELLAGSDERSCWNRKVFFLSQHSRAKTRWISFLRNPKVPCIVGERPFSLTLLIRQGPNIPHSNSTDRAEKRAFFLLLLFKPWRKITDVKYFSQQSWEDALCEFERICGHKPFLEAGPY